MILPSNRALAFGNDHSQLIEQDTVVSLFPKAHPNPIIFSQCTPIKMQKPQTEYFPPIIRSLKLVSRFTCTCLGWQFWDYEQWHRVLVANMVQRLKTKWLCLAMLISMIDVIWDPFIHKQKYYELKTGMVIWNYNKRHIPCTTWNVGNKIYSWWHDIFPMALWSRVLSQQFIITFILQLCA